MKFYLRECTLVWPEDDDPFLRGHLRKRENATTDIDRKADLVNIRAYLLDFELLEATVYRLQR